MKIAFLILCHKNNAQVNQLIHQLDDKNTDFYVHIDAKASIFESSIGFGEHNNVFFLKDSKRINVKWASFSMIEATLNLINACLSSGNRYDYVILISGQCFPVKSISQLMCFLSENKKFNFIELKPHTGNYRKVFPKRNEIYYPEWMFSCSTIIRIIRKLYIFFTGGHSYTFPIFRRNNTTGLEFAFGSQWWCLQVECLEWMMNYINCHPEYIVFFKHALTPDESFFQTLFVNSPYAKTQKDKLVWLEWKGNHPRLIDERDIERLVNSPCFYFARKFDMYVNPKPIEMLIDYLNGK